MDHPPLSIAVLGGGTAGWMSACLLAAAWPAAKITVVEAPDIPILGVGEGSTPQLKAFFDTIGVAEAEWMPACHATYKAGIAFHGWSERPEGSSYFHPFAGPTDLHTEGAFHASHHARRTGEDVPAHPDRFFLATRLAEKCLAPVAPEHFPFGPGYGYHFDAHLVGAFLRAHAVGRGVSHRVGRVADVLVGPAGDVEALVLQGGDQVTADLFIDASGFRSVIAGDALRTRFLPFSSNLFCDRAVVAPTPADISVPQTTATALRHGWAWRIPLTSRTGNGYIYSSRYASEAEAETELRAHLGLPEGAPVRHLSMRVGRVEMSWTGNCLAVGLAQGFIEPLEATALHLVQATVEGFIKAYAAGGYTPQHRAAFNDRIARRYEGVRDYIVAHYRLNGRTDTPFWRDNAANDQLSDDLKALMTAWFTGRDIVGEIDRLGIAGYYAPLSWGCLFAGYGTFPTQLRAAGPRVDLPAINRLLERCCLNFRDHAAVLADLGAC